MLKEHPKGLKYLFLAEMWERFSYYGMRAILTLFLIDHFFKGQTNNEELAYGIYAAYGSLIWGTPVIGGFLADKYLGFKKAVMLGGILMTIGHFLLIFEHQYVFFSGLAFLVIGCGFFKPNASTMVGTLYNQNDLRREQGYTIYYMGINIGAFLSPILCGWLALNYGWHYGFSAAGFGMLLGLIVFYIGIKRNVFNDKSNAPSNIKGLVTSLICMISIMVIPLITYVLVHNEHLQKILLIMLVGVLLLLFKIIVQATPVERDKLLAASSFIFLMVLFWAFYEQCGSSITIFAQRNVNLKFGMNAAMTNSINPFIIILIALPISYFWSYLVRIKKNPFTPVKYSLSYLQLGIGFLIFAFGSRFMDEFGRTPFLFLVLGYFFHTTAELFASPVGLSKITELAPQKVVGFMMGVWFFGQAFGFYISGLVSKLTVNNNSLSPDAFLNKVVDSITGIKSADLANQSENIGVLYNNSYVFVQVAGICIIVSIIIFALYPLIKKIMHGVH